MTQREKFFFIHIPKTGGSFFQESVIIHNESRYINRCHSWFDPVNILDWGSWDYQKFRNNIPIRSEPNYYKRYQIGKSYSYRDIYEEDEYIFTTIVRNPFSWLVSYFAHNGYNGWAGSNVVHNIPDFYDFVSKYLDDEFKWHCEPLRKNPFGQLYNNKGNLVPTEILRWENIEEQIKNHCEKFDLNYRFDYSAKNASGLNPEEYRSFYEHWMVEKLEKKWEKILHDFDYGY